MLHPCFFHLLVSLLIIVLIVVTKISDELLNLVPLEKETLVKVKLGDIQWVIDSNLDTLLYHGFSVKLWRDGLRNGQKRAYPNTSKFWLLLLTNKMTFFSGIKVERVGSIENWQYHLRLGMWSKWITVSGNKLYKRCKATWKLWCFSENKKIK